MSSDSELAQEHNPRRCETSEKVFKTRQPAKWLFLGLLQIVYWCFGRTSTSLVLNILRCFNQLQWLSLRRSFWLPACEVETRSALQLCTVVHRRVMSPHDTFLDLDRNLQQSWNKTQLHSDLHANVTGCINALGRSLTWYPEDLGCMTP